MSYRRQLFLLFFTLLMAACGERTPPLPEEGFGAFDQQFQVGRETRVPVYLTTSKPVKGVEFMLSWNPELVRVATPEIRTAHAGFSVHARTHAPGLMKVLVFNMRGGAFDLSDPWILEIPVTPATAGEGRLTLGSAVFAGPNATSYDLPVRSAAYASR